MNLSIFIMKSPVCDFSNNCIDIHNMLSNYFGKFPVEQILNSKKSDKQLEIKAQDQTPYLREDIRQQLFQHQRNPLQDALLSDDPFDFFIGYYQLMAPESYSNLKLGADCHKRSGEMKCDKEGKCEKKKCDTPDCPGCDKCKNGKEEKKKPWEKKKQAKSAAFVKKALNFINNDQ